MSVHGSGLKFRAVRVGKYIFSLLQAHTTGNTGTSLELLRGGYSISCGDGPVHTGDVGG